MDGFDRGRRIAAKPGGHVHLANFVEVTAGGSIAK